MTDYSQDWSFLGFGEQFDAHALAHLPQYDLAHGVIAQVASHALPAGGLLVDVGTSTGQAIARVSDALHGREFSAVGYDVDQSMLDVAQRRLDHHPSVRPSLVQADLTDPSTLVHREADLTLVLWTLQFLPPASWPALLGALRSRSSQDGCLLVAAKTRQADSRWQEVADAATVEYKTEHGVTPDDVLGKARSLRGTMSVVSLERVKETMERSGWSSVTVLFRWHAWVVVGGWATSL